jgi:hypothetical protein
MTDEKRAEITRLIGTFDRNVSRIEKRLEDGLSEESIILIVSTFEAFLRDTFVLCKSRWFFHRQVGIIPYMEKPDTRRSIRGYLQKIRAYDEFLKTRYVYLEVSYDPDLISLYEVLFEGGREKINFQNLKGDYGAKVAYKTFFDIDILNLLDHDNSTSHKRWKMLINLFEERHAIVHDGKATAMSQEDICIVLDSIRCLEKYLLKKLIIFVVADGG